MSAERDGISTDRQDTNPAAPAMPSQTPVGGALTEDSGEGLWQRVQQSIREQLGLERFSIWFRQTELLGVDDERLVVGVPNVIIQQYLSVRYADAVAAAAEELTGQARRVSFEVAPRLFREQREGRGEAGTADTGDLQPAEAVDEAGAEFRRRRTPVPRDWTFDRLITCQGNALALAAAREVAGQERPRISFLYVCGGFGSGKTAILRAARALAAGPESGLNAAFVTAEDWSNEYYRAIQMRTTHVFRARYRACDVFLMDDVQFVQGKAGGQAELLHTAKHILSKGGRVVLSGVPHPEELVEIDPALRALLLTAFPAVLMPPGEAERVEAAKALAVRHHLNAADGVIRLLAERHADSFGALESAIVRLALYAGLAGCGRMELADARKAFAATSPAETARVDLGTIRAMVAEAFSLEPSQLSGRGRSRTVARARHIAVHLAGKQTDASLTEIGRFFGGITHSSVKYGMDKVADELGRDPELTALLQRLERKLRSAGS